MVKELSRDFIKRSVYVRRSATPELFKHPEIPWSNDALGVVEDPRHLNALHEVIRWQGNNIKTPATFKETNKDHVLHMRSIFETDIAEKLPKVFSVLNKRTATIMILSHDSEEIRTGDLAFNAEDPELHARKEFGEKVARRLLLSFVKEPARTELAITTERYHNKDAYDQEAHITKWLDCIQSGRVAFDNDLYETIENPQDKSDHVFRAANTFVAWTLRTMHAFEEVEQKQEIQQFAAVELQTYYDNGFGAEVDQVIQQYL